jgi:hypothetical protein
MTDGPPQALPNGAAGAYLLGVVADVSDLKARLAQVERSVPELAARLDGRFAAVEGQIARTQDHLAQQDQQQASFRLDMKSSLGTLASGQSTLASGLGALQAAEQSRAQDAREAAQRAQEAQQRSADQAAENRAETRRWALQTLASVGLMLPGVVWPLMVTRPALLRLGVPLVCIGVVLLLAALAWARSRQ